MLANKTPAERHAEQITAETRAQLKYGLYRWAQKDLVKREAVFDRMYGSYREYHNRVLQRASERQHKGERA